ncbi:hypothetical protein [Marinobacter fonticola]|uniref:hypothetical protein n=1 Tax=Marinobacter fonticola TaxID=2603215 RepID=UPI0011E81B8C|nr:hypothetical protein [Marinobacter fonticola]
MNELSVTKLYQRRHRFSLEFKAEIVAKCLEPGATTSLDLPEDLAAVSKASGRSDKLASDR